jgi:ketosteroid isomerase-like protein
MLEDDDVVVVEATVRHERSEGDSLHARFCDVFDMEAGKIKRLTSYLMMVPTVTSAVD